MTEHNANIFEKHAYITTVLIILISLGILYTMASIKIIPIEGERRSVKTVLHQFTASKTIDNNVGRFIKLREHRPNQHRLERPSRNYIKNIMPGSVERRYYPVNTDKDGFIGPSEIHADPDVKILFLGGSTTECLYMDEKERFPYLVGRILEQKTSKKINTYNGGVSANESMHSINILINKGFALNPQIVVMMHNINDLVMLRAQGTYHYPDSLKSHLQTARNVFTRYEFPPIVRPASDEQILKQFKQNLLMFIALCEIKEITPVLMTQANQVKNDPLYHQFNALIREVGHEKNIKIIDLANLVPEGEGYLYDSYHFTNKGSVLVANVVAKALNDILPYT